MNIRSRIGRLYVKCFERVLFVNWFNPLITFYLNFRSFPFSQAIHFPVFVFGWPRLLSLYGRMECVGKCKMGMITFNASNGGAPSAPLSATSINNWGKIIFHGKCQIYTSNKINISKNGILELGEGTKIMHLCNITAHESVRIGEQSWIVHRCQVLDSNFHFIADYNKHRIRRYTKPIEIGTYCWICNSSTIAAGSIIPNKTIIASNSLVNKDMSDIPEESIIGGVPARLIASGYRRLDSRKMQDDVFAYFEKYPDEEYYNLDVNVDHSICDVDL